jgi:integrase
MTRHRFQQGTVFKRGTRRKQWIGRWRESVIGEDGTRCQVQRSAVLGPVAELSKAQAVRLLQERVPKLLARHQPVAVRMSFRQFVDQYWKPAMLPTYKPSTKAQAEFALAKHLLPAFGSLSLSDIEKPGIQQFCSQLTARLAPDTVHGIHRFLRRVLSCAVEWGYLPANPARGVKLPPARRREPPLLTSGQFQQLLARLSEPARTIALLAMMTSMRIGELLALRWGRVDLSAGVLQVRESYYRGHFDTVKSPRSRRTIPLSPIVIETLRRHHDRHHDTTPNALVFATRDGRPLSDRNLTRRALHPACDAAGLPRLGWHSLRHLHGTLLASLGVPVAVAQAQLGHADPRITLSIYTHLLPGAQREAVEQLETLLFPSVPKSAPDWGGQGHAESQLIN